MKLRNIAVIAHVDHGKTTLVDALLKQSHVFRDNQAEMQAELIMDSNELEKERGITIMAKVCSVEYGGGTINIIDTPGHADFSGEVERTLSMADGALLIVDAQEGPMPQTRFVLKKALELNLAMIVVINKLDKPYADPERTLTRVENLFLELAQDEAHLQFPVLYAVGRMGMVFDSLPSEVPQEGSVEPLLRTILEAVPEPKIVERDAFSMVVSALDYDSHLGQLVLGKVMSGTLKVGDKVAVVGEQRSNLVSKVMRFVGIGSQEVEEAHAGEIVQLSGLDTVRVGWTIAHPSIKEPLIAPEVGEPTLHMTIGANSSPFGGREGQFVTSRQIGERLERELQFNVGLRLEQQDQGKFMVSGRGELHLSVLLETMRREGYELEVGKPEAITKQIDGVVSEPVEEVDIVVPEEYVGVITSELGKRLGQLQRMEPMGRGEVEFVYRLPTRALLGLRSVLLTATKGTVVMNSQVVGYEPLGEALPKLRKGVVISSHTGKAVEYGLRTLKDHGEALVDEGQQVYEGMIVGTNNRDDDIEVNVTKEKNLTNHRSKSHKGITAMAHMMTLSMEQALDFLEDDELLEITPVALRLRKRHLTSLDRARKG